MNPDEKVESTDIPPEIEADDVRDYKRGRAIVRSLTDLIGAPVVCVPMYPKSKRPRLGRFQNFTLQHMEMPEYIATLGRPNCNVAVLLGFASGGLCTFDFDDGAHAKLFLRKNPIFRTTLTTTASRGLNLWFHVVGNYPASFDLKDASGGNQVEFRANGRLTMIWGTHPSGVNYRVIVRKRPIAVEWSEIKWPSNWRKQVEGVRRPAPKPARLNPSNRKENGTVGPIACLLSTSKLENVVKRADGALIARCPACAEGGGDRSGNHLVIFPGGRFGCVVFSGASEAAREHRRAIFRIAGTGLPN